MRLIPSVEEQFKEVLNTLKESVEDLEAKPKESDTYYKELEVMYNDQEQYSRRQNVLILDIAEQGEEITDDLW